MKEACFELWQDGLMVASSSGPRNRALAEINHYALIYRQDGPVDVKEASRQKEKK